jgi:glutamine synthetase
LAAILTAGLDGIKNKIQPPPSIDKNIFQMTEEQRRNEGITALPGSLKEAINELQKSELAREVLGAHIFEKYIEAKTDEWDEYRTKVSKWETDQYLTKY